MSVKISDLSAGTTLVGTEVLPVVQSAATVKEPISAIYTYVFTTLTTTAVTPAAAGDAFLISRSGAAKTVDIDVLKTYVAAGLLWSGLSSGSAVVDNDLFAIDRSGLKKVTSQAVATYAIASMSGTSGTAPTSGDTFLAYRSGSAQVSTIDQITTYVETAMWGVTTVTSGLSTDTFLLVRSAAGKQITLANLETQIVNDTFQAMFNKVASLAGSGALGATDKYLLLQSNVATYQTFDSIESKIYSDFQTYVTNLDDIVTLADADQLYVLDASGGSAAKYTTPLEISTYVVAAIAAASSASPATGNIFPFFASGVLKVGTVDSMSALTLSVLDTYVLALSHVSSTGATDKFYTLQGSSEAYATAADILAYIAAATAELTNKTLTAGIIKTGLTASGSASNDFSGSTGTFKTSTGANTLGGATTINDAATPSLTTSSGKTNTGFVTVLSKNTSSAGIKVTCADTMGFNLIVSAAAVATADRTLTLPDPGGNDSVAYLAATQTFTNKTSTLGKIALDNVGTTAAGSTVSDATAVPAKDWCKVIGTTGHSGYGVKLLTGVAGQQVYLWESAGFACKVYAASGGNVGAGTDTSITLAANHTLLCTCISADVWVVVDLGARVNS